MEIFLCVLFGLLTGFVLLMSSEIRAINARVKEQKEVTSELKGRVFELQNRCAGCLEASFESVNG